MEKLYPVWIMVLLALGVMIYIDPIVKRPLEASFGPVDEANYATFDIMQKSVPFTGFAARRLSSLGIQLLVEDDSLTLVGQ